MLILRGSFQVIKEKILLWNCQCFVFYGFKLLFFFQFSENIIRRIAPQIIIFDCRCQDLMQHRIEVRAIFPSPINQLAHPTESDSFLFH